MEFVLEITDLARSGAGVARDAEGRVIFVPFTAPGDRVRVEIAFEDKRYAEARILEILSSSPSRVIPPCPVFGKCGGCEWQHLPYELQWKTKKGGVAHALKRVEVQSEDLPWDEFPAERIWEYRNRVQLRGFQESIGFYARSTKELVPIEKCFIARPELNERIAPVKDTGSSRQREYKVELEVFSHGEVTETWNAGHSARGFRQVHDEQNAVLQQWVGDHIGEGGMLLDLYGGSGNLSLNIASRFSEVHCVDFGAPRERSQGAFHFHRSSVLQWLQENRTRLDREKEIRVILDPPREGLGPDLAPIIEILRSLSIKQTLLIGCEPDPWARAVQRFQKRGWKLKRLGALDFFPQTHHVEALAAFEL